VEEPRWRVRDAARRLRLPVLRGEHPNGAGQGGVLRGLAQAAFTWAVTGMAGKTMAIVMISSATTEGGAATDAADV
jgi:hypothetical protein